MNVLTGLGLVVVPIAALAAIDWLLAGRRKAEAARADVPAADTSYSLIESRSNQTRDSGPFIWSDGAHAEELRTQLSGLTRTAVGAGEERVSGVTAPGARHVVRQGERRRDRGGVEHCLLQVFFRHLAPWRGFSGADFLVSVDRSRVSAWLRGMAEFHGKTLFAVALGFRVDLIRDD
ncbi:MAG: hypothetical protein WB471_09775 [Nocardioides sp.]